MAERDERVEKIRTFSPLFLFSANLPVSENFVAFVVSCEARIGTEGKGEKGDGKRGEGEFLVSCYHFRPTFRCLRASLPLLSPVKPDWNRR
jgi:hypothetical protein